MEEEMEVEILDGDINWQKHISANVRIQVKEVPIQNMIVNGQQQVMMGKVCVIVCPSCGQIIQQFQPGASPIDILQSMNTGNEDELKSYSICPHCGQKLSIMRPMPVDVEGIEIQEDKKEC